jgi:hypothetical protein
MFRRRAFTHHRVGDSRFALVFGRKSDCQPVGNTNFRPDTGSLSAIADQPFGERLLPLNLNCSSTISHVGGFLEIPI